MAVFKIFPDKDSFISSQYPNSNFGRDEILDVACDSQTISRALIQFSNSDINKVKTLISGTYESNLKLFLANASNIPQDYNIYIAPLSSSWVMGTGRSGDEPNQSNGVCWNYATLDTSSLWLGGTYIDYGISQSFQYHDSKDVNCNVTSIVDDWIIGDTINNGFIIKQSNEIESSSNFISTQFFSSDTHTIYPPSLDFYWDDTYFSSSLTIINDSNFVSTITNNKEKFNENSIYTFRIKNRVKYPVRNFQTSSLYLDNRILPSSSYWALQDVKTKETIIDYHNIGTKIGADNNGNYFNLYMDGLEPERYYKILIKTIINNNTIIIDNQYNFFKITR